MTGRRPLLALTSRAVVALWIAVYLAGPVLAPPPEAEAETTTARVQPRPETPPEPARKPPPPPAPEPQAEPEPPQTATPERLGAAEVAAGDRILSGGGAFPVLSCTYEDFASFDAYARAMAALGARFVVVRQRRIVAAIDPATSRFEETEVAALGGSFSPRARDYTGEPALAPLTRAARERFGAGAVVMMLVPREVDAALFGGIARALASRGDHHEAYREIRGRYQRAPGGGLRLRVDRATRADGGEVAMDLLFDLAEVAGA